MRNWIPKIIRESIKVEKETKYGQMNQKAVSAVIVVVIISLVAGITFSYTPLKNINPLNGFSFALNSGTPYVLVAIILVSAFVCMGFLMYCKNKGWISSKDF